MQTAENRRILVVDDNPAIHGDFRKVFSDGREENPSIDQMAAEMFGTASAAKCSRPFEIDSAYQGMEGLQKVEQALAEGRPYSVAFVDIRMPPGWDGVETIEHLWKTDPELEVVICSAYSDYGWDEIVERLGETDRLLILKKPFEGIEVIQLAHALTRKWGIQRWARSRALELEETVGHCIQELEEVNERLVLERKGRHQAESGERLSQKLESMGLLAAGIAHEINSPMQHIGDNTFFLKTAFTNMMEVIEVCVKLSELDEPNPCEPSPCGSGTTAEKSADEKKRLGLLLKRVPRALDATLEGIGNVSKIVQAMRNFSHVDGDERVPTDLNAAVEAAVTVSKNAWKYSADVELDLDRDLPLVPGFAGELNQVLLNLIVNAAHAVEDAVDSEQGEKGTISIRTRVAGDSAEIAISDTGTGIPGRVQDRIFEPFFTTKDFGRGTGQGLAIARRIVVERHRGTLSFETEEQRGTTFFVRIPLQAPEDGTTE